MKIKCQECGTIIEIEDSEYPVGIEQTIECPLCQTEVSFTLNYKSNQTGDLPSTPPVIKRPTKVKSRLVKKEDITQSESLRNSQSDIITDENIVNDSDWEETKTQLDGLYYQQRDDSGLLNRFIYYLGYYHNYIKNTFIIGCIILAVFFIYKFAWNLQSQSSSDFVDTDSIEEIVDSFAINGGVNENDSIITFLTEMYEDSKYENYPFLNSHCTQHLLTQLSEAYDYDCSETPCYATWMFRTSSQDIKSSEENENRVLSVQDVGDNWFEIDFYDGGWKGKKRIKAYFKDYDVIMDIIETIYDEPSEYLKKLNESGDSTEEVALDNGTFSISILYERKLNESDISDLQPKDLELLRNILFARHGYRFSREDFMSFFTRFSWYTPSTDDASEIYEKMTEIEKYNVDFIRSHE